MSIVYGFIIRGYFTLAYIFTANFLAGVIVIIIALVYLILPAGIKFDKLTDHSTLVERISDQRKEKREKAYEFLLLGILVIIITGFLQLLLSFLIPG